MFLKLFELSFRDLLLFLKFLLKDVLHQLRKEEVIVEFFFTLFRWRINWFASLEVPKVAVANA
jgi:hypothetical protein